jgi:streptomycin 6-kinase
LRLEIPASFREMPRWWSEGSDWLDRLPDLVEALCLEWHLRPVARPMHGSNALVIPVQGGGEQQVLKLTPLGSAVTDEVTALRFWAGRGTVQLIDVDLDRGAMLLECLDETRTAAHLDLLEAMTVVGSLARRLAITAPADVTTTADIAGSLAENLAGRWQRLGEPFDRGVLHEAVELAGQLGEHHDAVLAVNADLHHQQVSPADANPGWPWTPSCFEATRSTTSLAQCGPASTRCPTLGRCADHSLNSPPQRTYPWKLCAPGQHSGVSTTGSGASSMG